MWSLNFILSYQKIKNIKKFLSTSILLSFLIKILKFTVVKNPENKWNFWSFNWFVRNPKLALVYEISFKSVKQMKFVI